LIHLWSDLLAFLKMQCNLTFAKTCVIAGMIELHERELSWGG